MKSSKLPQHSEPWAPGCQLGSLPPAATDPAVFDYDLPPERIAQQPATRRDDSRLMVVDRKDGAVAHHRFRELPALLPPGCRFFRNNVAVLKARIAGRRAGGGKVECLLLEPAGDPLTWCCLLKPGRRTLQAGSFGADGDYRAEVLGAEPNGGYRVRFEPLRDASVVALAARIGATPLPPYIHRKAPEAADEQRYETVYADPRKRLAVAAPTAGLHFTPDLIARLQADGHRFLDLTLQVGPGTFQPIQVDDLRRHRMHFEHYEIPAAVRDELATPERGPRVAVGTTVVRSAEDACRRAPAGGAIRASTDIFLYPPAEFIAIDALVTNFHLPRSTLMCLVAAFLDPGGFDGIHRLKELYASAVERNYRFFSYGDAMLIL